MAEIQITFEPSPEKPKTLILFSRDGEVEFKLDFAEGAEKQFVEFGTPYAVHWELVGADGDSLTVKWHADNGLKGVLIDAFKIDKNHPACKPFPHGPLIDYGATAFQAGDLT